MNASTVVHDAKELTLRTVVAISGAQFSHGTVFAHVGVAVVESIDPTLALVAPIDEYVSNAASVASLAVIDFSFSGLLSNARNRPPTYLQGFRSTWV